MDLFHLLLSVLVTLAAAAAGAWAAVRLHVKAGALVGALLAVSAISVASGLAFLPSETKVIAQLIAGAVIGASVTRQNLGDFRKAAAPSLVFLFLMLLIGLFLGASLSGLYRMDWLTAMFTAVPGGMTEMTIISLEMGADVSVVILFQLLRLFSTILLAPLLVPKIARLLTRKPSMAGSASAGIVIPATADGAGAAGATREPASPAMGLPEWTEAAGLTATAAEAAGLAATALTRTATGWPAVLRMPAAVLASFLVGLAGQAIGFPGGALTFSMIAMIALNLRYDIGALPIPVKRIAQMLSGAYIGCQVTESVIGQLPGLLAPMVFITVGFFVLSLSAGYIIHRIFRVDLLTALFSSAPAGASDMALISMEFDAAGSQVTLFHTVRLIGVIALAPPIIRLLMR